MDMKNFQCVIAAMLFAINGIAATNGNSKYQEALSNLEDRLLSKLLEKEVSTEIKSSPAHAGRHLNDVDDDEVTTLDDRNDGRIEHKSAQRKRLPIPDAARLRPIRVCRPYIPFLTTFKCCERGVTHLDLTNNSPCDGFNTASGIEILQQPTSQSSLTGDCNKRALLKINFEKFTKMPCDYCLRKPLCGRRMLRIDLALSSGTRSGWGFNIGDSRTNDGYKGDANTQQNDAETEGVFPAVRLYHSDKCDSSGSFKTFPDALGPNVNHVTIYVSNQHIRIMNDQGLDEYVCDKCLYALNGQADNQGINEDIYIALNRVITGRADRNGQGICSATLTWLCSRW